MSQSTEPYANELLDWFACQKTVLVAFSGGVDSAVVAQAAQISLGDQCLAVTADSPSLSRSELQGAVRLAQQLGIRHRVANTAELDDPRYQANDGRRCYYCKSHLFDTLSELARHLAVDQSTIVTGVNLDDLSDYRPGLEAAKEYSVRHPLAELGIDKMGVRRLARHWGLPVADKPAGPCLASRIAYGISVTPERLAMIEKAECVLRELGIAEFRVRLHADDLARIEVAAEWIETISQPDTRNLLTRRLRSCGFRFVTVDLDGFRSGSLNQLVTIAPSTQ